VMCGTPHITRIKTGVNKLRVKYDRPRRPGHKSWWFGQAGLLWWGFRPGKNA
jgi:hypothetical protein